MDGQNVGVTSRRRLAMACATLAALMCSWCLSGSSIASAGATAVEGATVGVGSQRSTQSVSSENYVSTKLGEASSETLYSEAGSRTAIGETSESAQVETVVETPAEVVVEQAVAAEPVEVAAEAAVEADSAGVTVTEASVVADAAADSASVPTVIEATVEDAVAADGASEAAADIAATEAVTADAASGDAVADASVTQESVVEEAAVEESVTWYTTIASAYSIESNGGTATASGIALDETSLTAASPWLPLGTVIEISYNGMTVQATVTDRGPYVSGRELDLAPAVWRAFGCSSTDEWGVRTVSYRVVS